MIKKIIKVVKNVENLKQKVLDTTKLEKQQEKVLSEK